MKENSRLHAAMINVKGNSCTFHDDKFAKLVHIKTMKIIDSFCQSLVKSLVGLSFNDIFRIIVLTS